MPSAPLIVQNFSQPFVAKISVPGSKSLTNRVFPLGVLSGQKIIMEGGLESEDAEIMREALLTMGAKITKITSLENSTDCSAAWQIEQENFFEDENEYEIFCGNSGTTIRFLTALCALRKGNTVLTGIERMKQRPLGDLVEGVRQLGVRVEYLENKNFPPIKIFGSENILSLVREFKRAKERALPLPTSPERGGKNITKKISLPGNLSSQFFTALFHIAPVVGLQICVQGELVSKPYIDMTLELMRQFGIEIENHKYKKFSIARQNFTAPHKILVEGDASSASYPLAIAAITGGKCAIENLPKNSLQGDAKFSEMVIEKMVGKNGLHPLGEINLEDIPDVAMTAVVLCAYADGYSKITGLSTLRHKECDRIFALESNLKKMGAKISSGKDYIEIWGNPEQLHGAEIECYNDHRVAMCFAVLGTVVEGVKILDPDCTKKTYPTFWEDIDTWRSID